MLEMPTTPDSERLMMMFNDLNDFCIAATGHIGTVDAASISIPVQARMLDERRHLIQRDQFSETPESVCQFFAEKVEAMVAEVNDDQAVYDLAEPIFKRYTPSRDGGIPPLELPEKVHWLHYMGAEKLSTILKSHLKPFH